MKPGQALAVYGGTFDPVHNGHLACAEAVAALSPRLRLLLVPTGQPPHRPPPEATAKQRLAMLELAVAGRPQLAVDARELCGAQPRYSYDTLQSFRQAEGADLPILFVMGLDSWRTLPSWRHWRRLIGLAHLLVLARAGPEGQPAAGFPLAREWGGLARTGPEGQPGGTAGPGDPPEELAAWQASRLAASPAALLQSPAGQVCHLPMAAPVSGTQVRAAYRRGEAVAEVPPAVDNYIRQQGLYLALSNARNERREQRLAERED